MWRSDSNVVLSGLMQKGNGAFAVEPEDAILGAPDHTAAEEQKIAAEEHKTADTR